jgi:hypothetical protein
MIGRLVDVERHTRRFRFGDVDDDDIGEPSAMARATVIPTLPAPPTSDFALCHASCALGALSLDQVRNTGFC